MKEIIQILKADKIIFYLLGVHLILYSKQAFASNMGAIHIWFVSWTVCAVLLFIIIITVYMLKKNLCKKKRPFILYVLVAAIFFGYSVYALTLVNFSDYLFLSMIVIAPALVAVVIPEYLRGRKQSGAGHD